MMRSAWILLLAIFCLSAQASEQPVLESGASPQSIAVSNDLKPLAGREPSTDDEPSASEEPLATKKLLEANDQPTPEVAQVESGNPAINEKNTMPLKKVSVSEASNWPFVLLTLLGMIICILLIAWMVKRFSGLTGMGGRDLKIVSAIAVGTRERVAIVEVRGEQFLIGATPHNISLLHHFSEEQLRASVSGTPAERAKTPSAFADKLQTILKQGSAADSESK